MRASRSKRFARIILAALLVSMSYGTITPATATGKTRPPVEAGDPEIGNEKPRGGPNAAYSFMPVDKSTSGLRSEIGTWYQFFLVIRFATLIGSR